MYEQVGKRLQRKSKSPGATAKIIGTTAGANIFGHIVVMHNGAQNVLFGYLNGATYSTWSTLGTPATLTYNNNDTSWSLTNMNGYVAISFVGATAVEITIS